MHRTDRWLGLALALLGALVFWTSRSFPSVPGQKLGAGFLPGIVGIGLVLAALALLARSRHAPAEAAPRAREGFGAAAAVVGSVLFYIVAADRLGFLIVAPVGLVALFRAFGVGWRGALLWALGGTIVVHVAFYKLLRVPLPWGVFRPFY